MLMMISHVIAESLLKPRTSQQNVFCNELIIIVAVAATFIDNNKLS